MSQFRISPSEERPIPSRPVLAFASVERKGDVVVGRHGYPWGYIDLDDELYLRGLLPLDPDDDDELIQFNVDHGLLYVPPETLFRLSTAPLFIPPVQEAWRSEAASKTPKGTSDYAVVRHLEELRLSAHLVRSLVAHWLSDVEGKPAAEAWAWVPKLAASEERCTAAAVLAMNMLLKPFAPGVIAPAVSGRFSIGVDAPPLASALAAQLFNAMVEDLPVRSCPVCAARFVRQTGRAQHGQHRTTSVTYCSSSCARIEANRAYRARKRKGNHS